MTKQQENEQVPLGGNLLTLNERAVCEQIASGKAPHSQRALVFLALNEGSTQVQAAEKAGLTKGQARYWIAKFRKKRLGIFPKALLDELEGEAEVEAVAEMGKEPESVAEMATISEDEPMVTKAKKRKKAVKVKKEKLAKKKTGKADKKKKGKKAKTKKEKKDKGKKDKGKKAIKPIYLVPSPIPQHTADIKIYLSWKRRAGHLNKSSRDAVEKKISPKST